MIQQLNSDIARVAHLQQPQQTQQYPPQTQHKGLTTKGKGNDGKGWSKGKGKGFNPAGDPNLPIAWVCQSCSTVHNAASSWRCRNWWCQEDRPDDDALPGTRTLGDYIDQSWGKPGPAPKAGGKQGASKGEKGGNVAQIIQQHVPQHMYAAAYHTEDGEQNQAAGNHVQDDYDTTNFRTNPMTNERPQLIPPPQQMHQQMHQQGRTKRPEEHRLDRRDADDDWEEYIDEDGHEDNEYDDSDEENITDCEADKDDEDLSKYPAFKARRAIYEMARESGMPANIVEEYRVALQQEMNNTTRMKDDASTALKQRAAVSSSHAHKYQEHKNIIIGLDEKNSNLDNVRSTADGERRDAIKHAQFQYELAINTADATYEAALHEAKMEKGRLHQQRQEEIDRFNAWEKAANATQKAIAKKLDPEQNDDRNENRQTQPHSLKQTNKRRSCRSTSMASFQTLSCSTTLPRMLPSWSRCPRTLKRTQPSCKTCSRS